MKYIARIIQFTFTVFFTSLVILFLFEFYKTGFVTNYLHFNLALIITLLFGIVSLILGQQKAKKPKRFERVFLPPSIALLAAVFVYTIMPENYDIYKLVPLIVGVGIYVSIKMLVKV